ncbi:hypothetical protein JDV02_000842 [Purpureocillium takamizusanense]|uniref:Uncharacterized protein n=1 Tax=Purpureocillium takamizusanense TaxID=2060973 RepID=A0A9Q8Q6Z7_9HYPO|nr:uncharacterized protein JDV02_000842 [Purpureocillium takamizusanense]UNI14185.1 hypothetical protein JDV02_000842 [Purpureocillium takamizusanense]
MGSASDASPGGPAVTATAAAASSSAARPTPAPSLGKPASVSACGTSSGFNGPLGHAVRRTKTFDVSDSLPSRRRPSLASRSEASYDGTPRRSSNFSDYSSEARDILNPRVQEGTQVPVPESSSLASLSLAFALLPAVAGALFKNGHAVVTDVMLLGLAGVFLHWSVTQPWVWYHSAQQMRIENEPDNDIVIEDDSETDGPNPGSPLDDVPEEDEAPRLAPKSRFEQKQPSKPQQAALRELYRHEALALVACLLLPLVSAYLLHAIRSQLSRPSEGLVSNYNLTIFLLISELRVFSHMIKLVQSRTLYLQRVVHGSPFAPPAGGVNSAEVEDIVSRLQRLEARSVADEAMALEQGGGSPESARVKQEALLTRDVRNAIQPELDALNRAVRRYEKKATLLQLQTEARFSGLDDRLDDAIALAAAAEKNSVASRNLVARAVESVTAIVLFPFHAMLQLLVLPLRPLLALVGGNKRGKEPSSTKQMRGSRTGKAPAVPRYNGDRVPGRVMKR